MLIKNRKGDCDFTYYSNGIEIGSIFTLTERGHIQGVLIYEEFRGLNHSEKMMSELLEWMRDNGFSEASLVTTRRNIPALACYKRVGFRIEEDNGHLIYMSIALR